MGNALATPERLPGRPTEARDPWNDGLKFELIFRANINRCSKMERLASNIWLAFAMLLLFWYRKEFRHFRINLHKSGKTVGAGDTIWRRFDDHAIVGSVVIGTGAKRHHYIRR